VNRRAFLRGSAAAAAALAAARWSRAAELGGAPADTSCGHAAAFADSAATDSLGRALPSLTLVAGGDTTLGYNLEAHFDQQLAAGRAKAELWPLYFAGIRPVLDAADLAIVNLECPFTKRGEKLQKNFNFRARPELVKILQAGSVDVVTLANNHMNDWGADGVKDTMHALDHAHIAHFGAGTNLAEARKPKILERHGIKVGFLGYYFQADPDMLEPEAVYATATRAGVAGCYKDLACMRAMVSEDVTALVPRVDHVVPFFHWGHEGSYEIRDYQIELAHLCVDLGAKAVLGAHPHRVQGVETYRGAPIFYSLGNFVYGGIKEPSDTLTMMARMRFTRAGVAAETIPVEFTSWPDRAFQPVVLQGEKSDDALARIAGYSRGLHCTLAQLEPIRAALPPPIAAPADSTGGR
jgi:poly-gamma-glutamate capsule biosynthesis protein CapA/YwtB (metallophosphatase superfamily)